jgi:epsilon-lactone hydrolase
VSREMRDRIADLRDLRVAAVGRPRPSPATARATVEGLSALRPAPSDVTVTEVDAGGVPACWFTAPGADAGRVLMFLHAGGYQVGSHRSSGELAARLGRESGMRVLAIGYRLAPEHPFPAAVDDALTAWHWLRGGHAPSTFGVAPASGGADGGLAGHEPAPSSLGAGGALAGRRCGGPGLDTSSLAAASSERVGPGLAASSLAAAGASAGGGLVLALLVALRDAGEEPPAAAALMSPWTDLSCSGPSMTERAAEDPALTADELRALAAEYLAGADPRHPLASPLFAAMTGLPPLLVQVGDAEILLSDSERLAAAAADAGVDVTLQVAEALPHVYQAMLGTPEAAEATTQIGTFLRARLSAGVSSP